MLRYLPLCLLSGAALAAGPLQAAECRAVSPAHTIALVELYTSEGCSSCPPADDWVRTLERKGYGADRLAAVAFHVDYWDYIGWKDRFADARYSARQKRQSQFDRSRVIYTPQVVLAGRDFRRWSSAAELESSVKRLNAIPARARIEIEFAGRPGGGLTAQASAMVPEAADRAGASLHLALIESGLSTAVAAGENRGATLKHDRVSRAYSNAIRIDASGRAAAQVGAGGELRGEHSGAVAFVQRDTDGAILQALHLPYCQK